MSIKRGVTRRRFLTKATGTAVGVVGIPYFVRSSALGQGPSTAAGERITLGFIGCGKQGTYLLQSSLNSPGTQVLAVCDVDKLKLRRAKRMTEQYYADQSGPVEITPPDGKDYKVLTCRHASGVTMRPIGCCHNFVAAPGERDRVSLKF